MAKLVDARDSKSRGSNIMSVRVRPSAPSSKEIAVLTANCIFCKIIQKQIPSTCVLETEHTIVIKDLYPKAPVHYLLIPKFHIEHMGYLTADTTPYLVDLGLCVAKLSKTLPENAGFNIISNNGQAVGQSVLHLHWHFLSGKNLYESGLSL